ncbi:MAG: EutP/PduV family microcompartment system protein [Lactobacillus sp.]|uniref:EutP/PduV family microcompartment system protein n=1 Tax=Limosilactobacillus agrestis TaxID=2759748 RepID=UPI0019BF2AB3|nr:EutP/PduV family microcompartment system protein [Limosilactobacillus agrestis]MBD5091033.1 EutP/PduV family microcompartment system protein [Lactobacillus sp.]MCD7119755.1 EutP/PduV family microcompartment system protein [Limosilactobacillus agrestis]
MKRTMFIGAIACGKTTLTQRLENQQIKYNKTQTIEFSSNIIDTPGEYMEHHNMMNTLRVTSMDADLVVLLQSAVDKRLVYPAGFCSMFSKPTLGVITKIDLVKGPADIEYSKNLLLSAGVKKVIPVSAVENINIDKLIAKLN